MLIQEILSCNLKYISIVFQKILQGTGSLTHWILAKSNTRIPLIVSIVPSIESVCELKIYSTSVWPICAHDPLKKQLCVKVRSIMRK